MHLCIIMINDCWNYTFLRCCCCAIVKKKCEAIQACEFSDTEVLQNLVFRWLLKKKKENKVNTTVILFLFSITFTILKSKKFHNCSDAQKVRFYGVATFGPDHYFFRNQNSLKKEISETNFDHLYRDAFASSGPNWCWFESSKTYQRLINNNNGHTLPMSFYDDSKFGCSVCFENETRYIFSCSDQLQRFKPREDDSSSTLYKLKLSFHSL